MEIQHQDRVALVTGGTGAIGTEICRQLAVSGARVATCFRNRERADHWQESNHKQGYDGFLACQADVSSFSDCRRMVEQVTQEWGPISILVNNAGVTRDTTLRRMSEQEWREVLSINLDSVFNVTRNLLDGMLKGIFGRIINISSINGQKGQRGQSNYSASKAGMHGFTMALAQEVAGKGVTVNTVSPGYIESEMVMQVPEPIRAKIISQIPVGRLGQVQEIGYLVNFLASDKSGFITGADFSINGGHHMG